MATKARPKRVSPSAPRPKSTGTKSQRTIQEAIRRWNVRIEWAEDNTKHTSSIPSPYYDKYRRQNRYATLIFGPLILELLREMKKQNISLRELARRTTWSPITVSRDLNYGMVSVGRLFDYLRAVGFDNVSIDIAIPEEAK